MDQIKVEKLRKVRKIIFVAYYSWYQSVDFVLGKVA